MWNLLLEAIAALHVVILVKEIGFRDVILERDALQIVQKINSENPNLSRIGHFVESIRQELGLLRSSTIVYVKRN